MAFLMLPHPLTNFEFRVVYFDIRVVYFDSFSVELVPEEIKEFIGNKNIKANIFRVQTNKS